MSQALDLIASEAGRKTAEVCLRCGLLRSVVPCSLMCQNAQVRGILRPWIPRIRFEEAREARCRVEVLTPTERSHGRSEIIRRSVGESGRGVSAGRLRWASR